MLKVSAFILFLMIFSFSETRSQEFGFGCLGFVGGYGGYSYQIYQPTGLNDMVGNFNQLHQDSLSGSMGEFGKAKGFRVGLNFFRANIEGFILTIKGFYQSISENKKAVIESKAGDINTKYEVVLNNFGAGLDLGTSLTGALSWKVIDAAVLFNTATFTSTQNFPGGQTDVNEYSTEKYVLGYSIGTGFIFYIIKDYVSLEGLAGYTVMKIDELQLSKNNTLQAKTINNFIESGGFNAVIQLNIGFPL